MSSMLINYISDDLCSRTESCTVSSFVQDLYKPCRCYVTLGEVAVFVADLAEVKGGVS